MLTKIREKTQGIIAFFILALITIPFALWGVNSYFDTGGQLIVAKVDGVEISQNDYRNEIDRLRGRVEPKTLDNPRFKQTVLDNLIDTRLMVQHAEDQGFRINNAQLAEIIRNQPGFQRDGKFDPEMYDSKLRLEGMSPQQFESRAREKILMSHLQTGISESRIVTQAEVADLVRLLSQEREIAYALIDAGALMAKMTVSGPDIEQYYSTHPEMFLFPEQVRVEYLRLSTGELQHDQPVSDDELKKAYADEAARYVVPEKRRASHILITLPAQPAEEQLKEALTRIQDIAKQARTGADFSVLAKKHSADSSTAPQGGDIGEIRRGVLPKELEAAIYALKPGEISQPVRSSYGYHLAKLTAVTPEKRKAFADVRKELIEVVRRRQGEERFLDVSENLRNLVYEQPDSLAPAAKALGLEIRKSDWFSHAGGTGMAANLKVIQAAFEPEVLNQMRNSDVIEIDTDTLVALRVVERRPAGRQPLAEVRPQVERALKQERALKRAQQLGEETLRELRAGGSLEALARKHGFKYLPPKKLTRRQTAGVDPRIVESSFRAPRPDGGKSSYELANLEESGYAVVGVNRVRDADGTSDNTLLQQSRELLNTRRGADYFNYYRARLRLKADVNIYPDKL